MKRLLDIIISLSAIIILSPVILTISLLIKLESKGPILFKQVRMGRNCTSFKIYKFRSMVVDADKQGPYYTSRNDTRITKVGRILRKTSSDELPQLYNVLKGEMSIVGPRPDVPAQKELYTEEEWNIRHQLQPGITGLAQATIRSDATPIERKTLDLEYIKKQSIGLDFKIILLTIKQLLRRGSY